MGVSGPRDSTTRTSLFRCAPRLGDRRGARADGAGRCLVGIDIHLGGVTVRSHSAIRVLVGVGGAGARSLAVRHRVLPDMDACALAMLTAICGSVATWFRFLLATIGGADSYGYVSASRHDRERPLDRAGADRGMAVGGESPGDRIAARLDAGAGRLRHRADVSDRHVARDGALHAASADRRAVFFVAPVTALDHARRSSIGWHASGSTRSRRSSRSRWSRGIRSFVAYAKQPMSDMPATMWVDARVAAGGPIVERASAFGAGLAAGAAVITRPALLVAAAVDSARGASRRISPSAIRASPAPDWRSACRSRWRSRISCSDRRSRPATAAARRCSRWSHVANQPRHLHAPRLGRARPALASRD